MEPVLLSVGGAAGAVSRYLVGLALDNELFPWSTLAVNVLGSFVLGVVLFGVSNDDMLLLVGVGFCGAFTTFSSFGFQTVVLWEQGEQKKAALNALANLVVSLAAFAGAWLLIAG